MSLRSQLAFVCALARTAAKDEEATIAINEAHKSIGNFLVALEQEMIRQAEEKKRAEEEQQKAAEAEEKKKQK